MHRILSIIGAVIIVYALIVSPIRDEIRPQYETVTTYETVEDIEYVTEYHSLPVDTILLIDCSPSMQNRDYPPRRIDAALSAAKTFLALLGDDDLVSVISFSENTFVACDFCPSDIASATLDTLEIIKENTGIGNALEAAIFQFDHGVPRNTGESGDTETKKIITLVWPDEPSNTVK